MELGRSKIWFDNESTVKMTTIYNFFISPVSSGIKEKTIMLFFAIFEVPEWS